MGASRYGPRVLIRELVLLLVAFIFCLPFFILVGISVETYTQTYRDPLSLPRPVRLSNYSDAWNTGGDHGLVHSFQSSLIITVSSVVALILIGSICAYTIARRTGRLSNTVYVLFVIGIILPFQLAIIPVFVAMKHLGLVGNYTGMVVLNVGWLMPLTVFLYTGFIRALPRDYEEAARVDGAGILRTYLRVVLPLLWPITATVGLLVGIIIWNEFFPALIWFGTSSHSPTVPIALSTFYGAAGEQWNLIMAGVGLAVAPIVLFYVFAQRHLIKGFAGGVKG